LFDKWNERETIELFLSIISVVFCLPKTIIIRCRCWICCSEGRRGFYWFNKIKINQFLFCLLVIDLVVEQFEYPEPFDFVEQLTLISVVWMIEVFQLNVHSLEKKEIIYLFIFLSNQ
jgi:hypothetical protein